MKIGFEYLKEANLTSTTEGRVLGAVRQAVGKKVQWVEGSHAGRNQHFCAKNAQQEWAVIIEAVYSLVARN
eukprot:1057392-Prymnesium_polylepis.1